MTFGSLKQANGSCTIHCEESDIKIITGVKIEIGECLANKPKEGVINLSIDSNLRGYIKIKKSNREGG